MTSNTLRRSPKANQMLLRDTKLRLDKLDAQMVYFAGVRRDLISRAAMLAAEMDDYE